MIVVVAVFVVVASEPEHNFGPIDPGRSEKVDDSGKEGRESGHKVQTMAWCSGLTSSHVLPDTLTAIGTGAFL